jgi:hypothetical protein
LSHTITFVSIDLNFDLDLDVRIGSGCMGDKAGNEEWGGTYDDDAIPEIRRDVEHFPDDQPQDLKKNVAFQIPSHHI